MRKLYKETINWIEPVIIARKLIKIFGLFSCLGEYVAINHSCSICNKYQKKQGEKMTTALTNENVEKVLDELRPFLVADGGNVELVQIDGPNVHLKLQGACRSCASSTMTLKMGIERKLRLDIPEIVEVIAVM